MKKATISEVITLLSRHYGKRIWKITEDPIAVLIQTILSQNTSDTNSGKAFASLQSRFRTWGTVSRASLPSISNAIKSGGLSDVKAQYIKQSLQQIKEKHGELELNFLKQYSLSKAREWLLQLQGVGVKTANCVLLFSLGMAALPVDTHVFRVVKRLGLVSADSNIKQVQIKLEKLVPDNDVYSFHVLLIEHGRKTCKAQQPLCTVCTLRDICPRHGI